MLCLRCRGADGAVQIPLAPVIERIVDFPAEPAQLPHAHQAPLSQFDAYRSSNLDCQPAVALPTLSDPHQFAATESEAVRVLRATRFAHSQQMLGDAGA